MANRTLIKYYAKLIQEDRMALDEHRQPLESHQ